MTPITEVQEHGEGCECIRCVGFTPGNRIAVGNSNAVRHGSYALLQLRGRADDLAQGLRDMMVAEDLWRPSFVPTVEAAAVVLARLERAERALAELDERLEVENAHPLAGYLGKPETREALGRLRQDAKGWANTARGYLADLGLNPASLARIARDTGVGRAARAQAALRDLGDHLEREYGADGAESDR